jgi:predicted hotdog family 3-hydroxylacyl-ACP dehydratase
MQLIDEVLGVDLEHAHCRVTVNRQGVLAPFLDLQGNLPGWYALELMAQTVGVWSGWHRHHNGQESIALGMVLGARELVCAAGHLPFAATLDIHVNLLMQDQRFGSFACTIEANNTLLASGRISTFAPTTDELVSLFTQGNIA